MTSLRLWLWGMCYCSLREAGGAVVNDAVSTRMTGSDLVHTTAAVRERET